MHPRLTSSPNWFVSLGLAILLAVSLLVSLAGMPVRAATHPAKLRLAPATPGNLSASANGQGVLTLHWADNSDNEDGFAIERSSDGGTNWEEPIGVAANVMTYDDTGLTCATAYTYRIYAYNATESSEYSNVVSATTNPCSDVQRVWMPAMSKPAVVFQAARLVDVSFSLHNTPSAEARAYYEGIIRYFADGIYEMTNTAHKIRRVTIYTNGQNADQANIIWKAPGQCWPNATISGYTTKGARVEMCDSNTSGEPYATANDADQQNGGYTTAHEWGHYFYGISDEYQGNANAQSFGNLGPLPSDTAVQNSVMNQQRQAILGTTSDNQTYNGDFSWLNFDTPLNNTGNNSQIRLYGASGWETLARPASADPRDESRQGYNVRDAYPELVSYAPPAGQTPSIELPAGRESARSDLQIIWSDVPPTTRRQAVNAGGDGVVRQILIATSASMANGNKLDAAKVAVRNLIEGAEVGDMIGVLQFDGLVTVTFPLTTITSETTKDALEAAVDQIQLGTAQTAIGDAMQAALDGFTSAGIFSDTFRTVYLIADSPNTTGRDPFGLAQTYDSAFVTLHTFGYGTGGNAASALQRLANQTGGDYYFVSDATELSDRLSEADEISSPVVDTDIAEGAKTVVGGVPLAIPFYVDSGLEFLEVEVAYSGAAPSATIQLLDGSNAVVGGSANAEDCEASDLDGEPVTFCAFDVDAPNVGTWTLQVSAPQTLDLAYTAIGTAGTQTNTFSAVAQSESGAVLLTPARFVIRTQVQRDWPITNLAVSGTLELPNGVEQSLILRDDGVSPDTLANDGIYMTEVSPTLKGDYFATVRFNNHANTAKYTQYSINLDAGRDGIPPAYREPWPVNENFERVATVQVTVGP